MLPTAPPADERADAASGGAPVADPHALQQLQVSELSILYASDPLDEPRDDEDDEAAARDAIRDAAGVPRDDPYDDLELTDEEPWEDSDTAEWRARCAAVNRLALARVAPRDVHEMIDEACDVAHSCSGCGPESHDPGVIVPGLVERIDRDCAGLLEIWTRHARPAAFWEDMFRLAVFSYLVDVVSEGGLRLSLIHI